MAGATRNGRLTLIQQNDTHAHVEPHHEIRWRNGRPEVWWAAGTAHVRALADVMRREAGCACFHVDSGDAIHGTGHAQWTRGASVVPVLNAVGVELLTPGNWEFGFGPVTLRERVAQLAFPTVACNVKRAENDELEFAPFTVREVGGLRVGMVGITSPVVERTMPRAFAGRPPVRGCAGPAPRYHRATARCGASGSRRARVALRLRARGGDRPAGGRHRRDPRWTHARRDRLPRAGRPDDHHPERRPRFVPEAPRPRGVRRARVWRATHPAAGPRRRRGERTGSGGDRRDAASPSRATRRSGGGDARAAAPWHGARGADG